MIVVACNTATCYAIEFFRKKYPSVTFVGTVPAIKPAARLSRNKSIAILSTPATAKSPYLKSLMRQNATGAKIADIGCSELENLVEEGQINSPEIKALVKKISSKGGSLQAGLYRSGPHPLPVFENSHQAIKPI